MVWGMVIGAGLGIASGIMQQGAAEDQAAAAAAARYQQEQDQMNATNFRGVMQTYQQNRAIAQNNAARRFRNRVLAKNANSQRAYSERRLKVATNGQIENISTAYKHTMAGVKSSLSGRGFKRGGTAKAIQRMMQGRSANEIVAVKEQARLQEQAIMNQQQAMLAQRDFGRDEAALFIPGASPTYSNTGTGTSMFGSIMSGMATGISMGSSVDSAFGGSPSGK